METGTNLSLKPEESNQKKSTKVTIPFLFENQKQVESKQSDSSNDSKKKKKRKKRKTDADIVAKMKTKTIAKSLLSKDGSIPKNMNPETGQEWTFKDAAAEVLRLANEPLSAREIYSMMYEKGMYSTAGKTPWNSVAAQIYTDMKHKSEKSRFIRAGPGKFALSGSWFPEAIKEKVDKRKETDVLKFEVVPLRTPTLFRVPTIHLENATIRYENFEKQKSSKKRKRNSSEYDTDEENSNIYSLEPPLKKLKKKQFDIIDQLGDSGYNSISPLHCSIAPRLYYKKPTVTLVKRDEQKKDTKIETSINPKEVMKSLHKQSNPYQKKIDTLSDKKHFEEFEQKYTSSTQNMNDAQFLQFRQHQILSAFGYYRKQVSYYKKAANIIYQEYASMKGDFTQVVPCPNHHILLNTPVKKNKSKMCTFGNCSNPSVLGSKYCTRCILFDKNQTLYSRGKYPINNSGEPAAQIGSHDPILYGTPDAIPRPEDRKW